MLGKTTNPELKKAEAAIAAKVPPEMQGPFQKIVTAGLQIMYHQGGKVMQQQLMKGDDYASNAAEGAAKLLGNMIKQSKGTLPIKAGVPAATVLMFEALSALEEAGKLTVDNNVIAEATKDFGAFCLQMFGVDKNKMAQMAANARNKGQQGQQPPAQPQASQPPAPPAQPGGLVQGAMGAPQ